MKKTIFVKRLTLGVMFVFAAATASFAGEGEKVKSDICISPYLNTDYSVISLSNQSKKTATLRIVDAEGAVVYKEWVKKEGLAQKVLDFSNLEDGEYTAILKVKGEDDLTEMFSVVNHKLILENPKAVTKEELKAFFNLVENTLFVSHITFGNSSFGISILDAVGQEVFEKDFANKLVYSGKFDVSALPNGQYTVNINSGSNKYSYDFNK